MISPDGSGLEDVGIHEIAQGSFSSDGGQIAYNKVSRERRTWKRYKGGTAQDIYLFDIYPVMDISDISVDPDLGASEAVVTLSNADQSMNIFLSDLTNHGNPARIELGISGESDTMTVFTGVIDHTEFSDRDMTCSLYLTQQSSVLNLLD